MAILPVAQHHHPFQHHFSTWCKNHASRDLLLEVLQNPALHAAILYINIYHSKNRWRISLQTANYVTPNHSRWIVLFYPVSSCLVLFDSQAKVLLILVLTFPSTNPSLAFWDLLRWWTANSRVFSALAGPCTINTFATKYHQGILYREGGLSAVYFSGYLAPHLTFHQ